MIGSVTWWEKHELNCSAGNHQGSGPFCSRCGRRISEAQSKNVKVTFWKKLPPGLWVVIGYLILVGFVGTLAAVSDEEGQTPVEDQIAEAENKPTETPTPDGIPYTLEDGYAAALAAYLKLADQPGGDEISSCILASFIFAEYPTIETAEDLDRMAYSLTVREEFRGLNVTATLIATSLDFCVSYLRQEGWSK